MKIEIKKLDLFLIIILPILISFQVYTSNKLATCGVQISQLDSKAQILEEENRKFIANDIEQFSLNTLRQKAEELGFVEVENTINFSTETIASN